MDLNGLTPEQIKMIFDLSKRIVVLESKLTLLQTQVIRVNPQLASELARNMGVLNLN